MKSPYSHLYNIPGAPGSASYSMSKHALHVSYLLLSLPGHYKLLLVYTTQGFFNTLRMEIAEKGVTVHMVCPGPVDTPFFKRHFGAVLGEVSSIPTQNECLLELFYTHRDLKLQRILSRRTVLE